MMVLDAGSAVGGANAHDSSNAKLCLFICFPSLFSASLCLRCPWTPQRAQRILAPPTGKTNAATEQPGIVMARKPEADAALLAVTAVIPSRR